MYVCMYVCMSELGLCYCAQALSNWGEWGPLFVVACRPLIVVSSPVAEHGL